MAKFKPKYTKEQQAQCITLFNRTELRLYEVVIDNRDCSIAKELNMKTSSVTMFISDYLNKKFSKINERINKN